MERGKHLFHFSARDVSRSAGIEADYHESRVAHWTERRDRALEVVKATISAKVVEHEVTNGTRASVEVDYGDRGAWDEYTLAFGKVDAHRQAAERYRTDEQVYGSQGERSYELDAEDVHHFRLGQGGRGPVH